MRTKIFTISSRTFKHLSKVTVFAVLLLASATGLYAREAGVASSLSAIGDQWTTYNGDYSGRRYSALTQINKSNVKFLTLAWAVQTHSKLKATPLEIGGILYVTAPDYVWAIDARTGAAIWTFHRPSEGDHLGQRGVGFYKDRVYFGTPDAHLICLDAKDGKKIWDVEVADVKFGYYITVAPLIVQGKVIVGTSGDEADIPHFVEAFDWENGKSLWKTSVLPAWNTAAAKTWPNQAALQHGGGAPWLTGTYDAALNLVYVGTGNPHPVIAGVGRAGDNLYTCSILALNADTGAIVWYFQPSPHDTHDWDAVETPVLFDAEFNGRRRRLLAQASRNGYFFLLDRATGEHLLTASFVNTNWAARINDRGQPVADLEKAPSSDGSLLRSAANGGTNWMPPSFDPQTNLFYVDAQEGFSFWYLALDKDNLPEDHQGGGHAALITKSFLEAIDYQTGKIRWRRESGNGWGSPGILTTAGQVLFSGDISGNLLALDPANGRVLWHTRPGGNLTNGPMTYQLDGRQYVVTGVGNMLYAWSTPND